MKSAASVFKKHYGTICLGVLFCGLLVCFQFMYLGFSDDRIYSTAAQTSLPDFFRFIRYHYQFVNGRIWVHVLLMQFLRFGVWPWRVFMPACFTVIVYLIARLVSPSAQMLQKTIVRTCIAFVCVPAVVYQETLFWETGSFNYILPVLVVCLLFLSLREGKHLWCTPVLAFLCGSSMEQIGMITFGCLLLWLGYRLVVQKEKTHAVWYAVSLLTTLAGLLTLVLSPSVRERTYAETGSLTDKISYLFFGFWFHAAPMCVSLVLLTLAACVYLYCSAEKRFRKIAAAGIAAAAPVTAVAGFLPLGAVSTFCTFGFAAVVLTACFWAGIAALRAGRPVPMLALLLGGGAQVMMLVTQRLAYRTTMPSVFCFIVFALSLLACTQVPAKPMRIAAIVCAALIAGYSAYGYGAYAVSQRAAFKAGECTQRHAVSDDSGENLKRVIAECEQVRLDQVELHRQAAEKINS